MLLAASLIPLLALAAIAAIVGVPRWRRRRLERLASRPFPADWRATLRRLPLYRRLPPPLQAQVRAHAQVLLAEVPVIGCAGLEVTDAMRVTIAAQAALLRLERPGAPFPDLRRILLYPGAFVVDRVHAEAGGVLREQRQALSGESWSQGQVILSWDDVAADAADPGRGHNVVLHEFAHQLDQASGPANGAPRLGSRAAQARWARVLQAEYDALQVRLGRAEALRRRAAAGRDWMSAPAGDAPEPPPELIDPYGATNPAEFFAVVTEVFFCRPHALAQRHPALFAVLADAWRADPRGWTA